MAKKKKQSKELYSWVVAYINSAYIDKIYTDLKKSPEYKDVEFYIPTVRILKKTFKGENIFQNVPLLFNYGFFKIPRKYAIHKSYLDTMKQNINCIFGWVSDTAKLLSNRPKLRYNNDTILTDRDVPVATATSEEIAQLVKAAYYCDTFDLDDIDRLSPGTLITLHGYPFDNIDAEVLEIFPEKHKVKVRLEMFDQMKEVMVSFDNVFFTVYHNNSYDDSIMLAGAIDAVLGNSLDHQIFKNNQNAAE